MEVHLEEVVTKSGAKEFGVRVVDVRLSSKSILDVIVLVKKKLVEKGGAVDAVVAITFERNDLKTAEDVAEMVRLFPSIRSVTITRNNLSGEGIAQLCRVLETRAHIQELDLGHNRLTDEIAQPLLKLLTSPVQKIHRLVLRDNNLTSDTAMALSKAMMETGLCALKELDIGINDLSDSGCMAISSALHINSTLSKLNMDTNIITMVGLQSLGEALRANTSLTSLSMRHNNLGEDGVKLMDEVMETNETLADVCLRGNKSTLAHTSI
eukprot:m.60475 g.60475  ORF g.60475 m.60475 type:complete len:267 (-) comp7946_c0_seq1:2470-3270(-)